MGYTVKSNSTGPMSDAEETPKGSLIDNSKKAKGKGSLITFLEKGQPGGNLYGAVDLPDGEWSVNQINARIKQQAEQFAEKYSNSTEEK